MRDFVAELPRHSAGYMFADGDLRFLFYETLVEQTIRLEEFLEACLPRSSRRPGAGCFLTLSIAIPSLSGYADSTWSR